MNEDVTDLLDMDDLDIILLIEREFLSSSDHNTGSHNCHIILDVS
jgi:hypothetical protein